MTNSQLFDEIPPKYHWFVPSSPISMPAAVFKISDLVDFPNPMRPLIFIYLESLMVIVVPMEKLNIPNSFAS